MTDSTPNNYDSSATSLLADACIGKATLQCKSNERARQDAMLMSMDPMRKATPYMVSPDPQCQYLGGGLALTLAGHHQAARFLRALLRQAAHLARLCMGGG